MFEMDKESFGQFLAQHRKEQGMTQKQLAERLFVSDKAVSKWERGLSLPDVSLLLPLSQLLGVSVTELLEGRQLEEPMAPEEVETLVQKALQYPEIPPEVQRLQRRRRLCIYLGAAAIALTECVVLYFGLWDADAPGRVDAGASGYDLWRIFLAGDASAAACLLRPGTHRVLCPQRDAYASAGDLL